VGKSYCAQISTVSHSLTGSRLSLTGALGSPSLFWETARSMGDRDERDSAGNPTEACMTIPVSI
jgi:hypothetical protein